MKKPVAARYRAKHFLLLLVHPCLDLKLYASLPFFIERFAALSPGEKVMLSPPDNSPLKSVTVTADHGMSVTKPYRIPWKIPGMMGS